MKETLSFEDYKNIVDKDHELKKTYHITSILGAIETLLIQNKITTQEEFDDLSNRSYDNILKQIFDKMSDEEKEMLLITNKFTAMLSGDVKNGL